MLTSGYSKAQLRIYVGPVEKQGWMVQPYEFFYSTEEAMAFIANWMEGGQRYEIQVDPFGSIGTGDPLMQYRTIRVKEL